MYTQQLAIDPSCYVTKNYTGVAKRSYTRIQFFNYKGMELSLWLTYRWKDVSIT